jgi:hypothetical protein
MSFKEIQRWHLSLAGSSWIAITPVFRMIKGSVISIVLVDPTTRPENHFRADPGKSSELDSNPLRVGFSLLPSISPEMLFRVGPNRSE